MKNESLAVPFHIVLVCPEIPPNTGNIGRLCVATGAPLHLVDPLGFDISDPQVKRAGLDYWQHLSLVRHKNLEQYLTDTPSEVPQVLLTKKAEQSLYDHQFEAGTHLVFGNETSGLPEGFMAEKGRVRLRIPMVDDRVRSLNLSTAVGIVLYEAIRQLNSGKQDQAG